MTGELVSVSPAAPADDGPPATASPALRIVAARPPVDVDAAEAAAAAFLSPSAS